MQSLVSIGMQCTIAQSLKNCQMRTCSYPFDWVLCSPRSLTRSLWILARYGAEYAAKDFLAWDGFVKPLRSDEKDLWEHYESSTFGTNYNSLTDVAFPHDKEIDHDKYTRRFQRLLDLFNSDQEITLMYAGPPNKLAGYTVDDKPKKEETVTDLEMLLDVTRFLWPKSKVQLLCFLSKDHPSQIITSESIEICRFEPEECWGSMADQITAYLGKRYTKEEEHVNKKIKN